ncbi:hypothetical protein MANES_09G081644v8 [Manihot esculenta]|uniref:Uncharacterized protein n=1 Tax=Manihot esculenta TaxID=3983 RepID=A0ACB7H476_MANES|nr:hypothetical protein MANES_09G081644v8 [Manihot esculenta]
MMTCVSTASYFVQVNGHKTGFIHPSREIQQDDTITYARASSRDAEEIKSVLYERASGQSINLANPVSFSPNTSSVVRQSVTSILHISHLEAPNKFLGLPADIPRSKHQIFFFIKVRVANKIAG